MASDFHDLRPEQVPNAVTQSFPNVHFLAKSSTVLGKLEIGGSADELEFEHDPKCTVDDLARKWTLGKDWVKAFGTCSGRKS